MILTNLLWETLTSPLSRFPLHPSISRYGLGMIYYKQEKFNLAEIHFKKALSINPQSSVLLCHIGVVSGLLHSVYFSSLSQITYKNTYSIICIIIVTIFKACSILHLVLESYFQCSLWHTNSLHVACFHTGSACIEEV